MTRLECVIITHVSGLISVLIFAKNAAANIKFYYTI